MENPPTWVQQATHLAQAHLGVDEATGEILAVVTTNDCHDGEVLADVLGGIKSPVEQVSTDGAYDHHRCYDDIATKGAKAVVPPVRMPRFGNTAIVKGRRIHAMRTYVISASMVASVGSETWAITAARLLKQPCFASRPFWRQSLGSNI